MRITQEQNSALAPVLNTLDEAADSGRLADKAGYSKAQYYRIFKKRSKDAPMAVRRRLLIERAAFELTRTEKSVTEIAFDAGYGSLEGFSRGFKAALGVAPLHYRRLNPTDYRIDATERIHYAPPVAPVGPPRQGEHAMNILERLIDHHCWSTERTLERCRELSDAQLDAKLGTESPFPWDCEPETLRRLLQRSVSFARPWMAAINDQKLEYDEGSIDGLKDALRQNCEGFRDLVRSIEAEGRWDLTFVDSLCEPPEVFSYVGVVGHVITFTAYRRVLLLAELKKMGITGLGHGDPIEYDPARRPE